MATYTEWAQNQAQPRFTSWLYAQNQSTWNRAITHRFVSEIAAGAVPKAVMSQYLIQDYSFLDSFVRLNASLVVKAPTIADRVPLCQFLAVVTGEENTYFQRAFQALGVNDKNCRDPPLRPVTIAFHDVMKNAVDSASYAETMAPLVVFEWLYHDWASSVSNKSPESFVHNEWITIHAGDGMRKFVDWIRQQMDNLGPTLSEGEQQRVLEIFTRTVELEEEFFDDVYKVAGM